jgi:hypothetical protein
LVLAMFFQEHFYFGGGYTLTHSGTGIPLR